MSTKIIYQSYTYYLRWTKYNMKYYGVRSAHRFTHSPEEDLWIHYHGSSIHVNEFRKQHGDPDIIMIRRKFYDPIKAKEWETKFLTRIDAANSSDWLNQSNGSPHRYGPHSEETKQKIRDTKLDVTWEDLHGEEKANEMKINLRSFRAGKTYEEIYGIDRAQKLKKHSSESQKGENHPNFGKTYEEIYGHEKANELKNRLSDAATGDKNGMFGVCGPNHPWYGAEHTAIMGKNNPNFKGYYITPHGRFESARSAVENYFNGVRNIVLIGWCKNNQRKLTEISYSKYQQHFTEDMIGKTYEELGFDFESL